MLFNGSFKNIKNVGRAYCTNPKKYAVLLPKTTFPLKLTGKKLIERDENIYSSTEFERLYNWQRGHLSEPEFVLHDGPPYANGRPHMGHAINKILKDTILRNEILKGNKVHYIPGWDCHGLPIELKALSNSKEKDPIEIRKRARNFAKEAIEEQKKIFMSWGVIGDWKHSYTTFSKDYMKLQLRQFFKLYKKNLVYRDIKPVHWSPSSQTALAEAELEYNEKHKSLSAYIQLKIKSVPKISSLADKDVYAIIWTTTPWTLPSNQAVCFNKDFSYSILKNPDTNEIYIVSTDLADDVSKILNINFEAVQIVTGNALDEIVYEHPVYKNKLYNFLPSTHVTNAKGTGLVHLAGAHGPDDFLVCLKNKMQIVDLVDDKGCYTSEAGPSLQGKTCLTDGNNAVLEILGKNLLHKEMLTHSYPYDWRTKKPVIIKASKQWFINTQAIKSRAVELLEDVNILPHDRSEIYKTNLITQIEKRPYWCISRQRKWGVPIPVLYNKTTSETIINENTISHHCRLVDEKGTDFWWKLNGQELLPENTCSKSDDIEKCEDIMDIWLDSGLSWSKVLEGPKVADMYLEGVDQFTGWFQSSLLTSVALRDKAPYKTIYVHGFAVDENGIKMSKSIGNVVDPEEITKGKKGQNVYGVDTLRWWVACHANQQALANVSPNVLESSAEEVQKIRSVLRFALGCLSDYENKDLNKSRLLLIDRYMLHLLYQFHNKISQHMQNFQYHKVSIAVINLLTNSVSALYYNSIKDRLYCDIQTSTERRAAQFTLFQIFEIITQSVAPMLPHLVEELYLHFTQKENKTFFTSKHSQPTEDWNNSQIEKLFEVILGCKREVNKEAGANTINKIVDIIFSKDVYKNTIKPLTSLEELEKQLVDILQVSHVNIIESDLIEPYKISVSESKKCSCPRCRKVNSEKENELCMRCYEVCNSMNSQTAIFTN
ncbi:isoleucine--tRNA ligase, mitochondrial [Diabrotica undecimpunctata]|uniref:isoleucine--tRNA ligase, mitochondrial n=1 Tax=Diabrotica undecimpunctata TaxID=50387 RepID=UPI003B6379BA